MKLFTMLKTAIEAFCVEKGLESYAPKEYNDEIYVIDPKDDDRLFGIYPYSKEKARLSYGEGDKDYRLKNKEDVKDIISDINDNYIFFMDSCKKANEEGGKI